MEAKNGVWPELFMLDQGKDGDQTRVSIWLFEPDITLDMNHGRSTVLRTTA